MVLLFIRSIIHYFRKIERYNFIYFFNKIKLEKEKVIPLQLTENIFLLTDSFLNIYRIFQALVFFIIQKILKNFFVLLLNLGKGILNYC